MVSCRTRSSQAGMSTGISRAHQVHRRFPFSGWPAMGTQLRILRPFQARDRPIQVRRRQTSGHGYAVDPPRVGLGARQVPQKHRRRVEYGLRFVFSAPYCRTHFRIGHPCFLRWFSYCVWNRRTFVLVPTWYSASKQRDARAYLDV